MAVESGDVAVERPRNSAPADTDLLASAESLYQRALISYERHGSARALARATVDLLVASSECARVSLVHARKDDKPSTLLAMSGQAEIDHRRALPACIVDAARETLVSDAGMLVYSQRSVNTNPGATRAHRALFENHGKLPCLSLAFPLKALSSGVPGTRLILVMQYTAGKHFDRDYVKALYSQMAPLLFVISKALQVEKSTWQQCVDVLRSSSQAVLHERLSTRNAVFGLCFLLLAASAVIPVSQQVSAKAAMSAMESRVLIASHAGIIESAFARAGDSVRQDQLLATLDQRDLLLEITKWRSELTKNERAIDVALANGDRIELGRLKADAARVRAELSMAQRRLARTELRAPFDGVVISGDLRQSLGAAVSKGDPLFTIAASDRQQLILEVDEQDIGLISQGQTVMVRLAALPAVRLPAQIDNIMPLAVSVDAGNVFRISAELLGDQHLVRTGMEGYARIDTGKAIMLAVYTRALRLKLARMFWRVGLLD